MAAKRDRQRRQYLAEGSFADAANHHGFKRARWRRLWRQQIQDPLIAAIQILRIWLARKILNPAVGAVLAFEKSIWLPVAGWLALVAALDPLPESA